MFVLSSALKTVKKIAQDLREHLNSFQGHDVKIESETFTNWDEFEK